MYNHHRTVSPYWILFVCFVTAGAMLLYVSSRPQETRLRTFTT